MKIQNKKIDFMADLTEFLSPAQVCEMLGCSVNYLQELRLADYNKDENGETKKNFLPFFKCGRKVLYKKSDILAWIEANMQRG